MIREFITEADEDTFMAVELGLRADPHAFVTRTLWEIQQHAPALWRFIAASSVPYRNEGNSFPLGILTTLVALWRFSTERGMTNELLGLLVLADEDFCERNGALFCRDTHGFSARARKMVLGDDDCAPSLAEFLDTFSDIMETFDCGAYAGRELFLRLEEEERKESFGIVNPRLLN